MNKFKEIIFWPHKQFDNIKEPYRFICLLLPIAILNIIPFNHHDIISLIIYSILLFYRLIYLLH